MSDTTRRVRRVDETMRESRRRRTTHSQLRGGGSGLGMGAVTEGGAPTSFGGWRRVAIILSVVIGAGVLAWLALRSTESAPGTPLASVARVERVVGPVLSSTPGATALLPLAHGGVLRAGDVVETGTAESSQGGGQTAIRLAGGPSLRLDHGSRAQLASDEAIVLDRGAVYVDARELGSAIEVRTTLGVVRDIGTQFEVRLVENGGPGLRVRVREGEVLLEREGTTHHAGLGEQLLMRTDGTVERSEISIWGPEWLWILGTAPVPPFEGSQLADFVDWLTREGGWSVRWEDPQLSELAKRVELGGSSTGLSALEAAEIVFSGTTDFAYHIDPEAGLLVIERRSETGEGE